MSYDCYCDDGGMTSAYVATDHFARKQHKCDECHAPILPGELYEKVFAIWEGEPATCKTCIRCLDLREFVQKNVKCFCWLHHNMIEDAIGAAEHYGTGEQEGSGLYFGALRRLVAIRRHKDASASTRAKNG